jgi:hypothetical protein
VTCRVDGPDPHRNVSSGGFVRPFKSAHADGTRGLENEFA